MSDRPRYYLTTSIAYANNAPGLHTVYEVIGADAIARWHRLQGHDTRFLTGTDEHSVNIAQTAEERGQTPREFVDAQVALFRSAEAALLISPDRFIRTTDPDHYRSAQEMVRRAYDNGDIYLGTYEGWYCPNEGFKTPSDLVETASGMQCPNHPNVPLQWLTERNWFFRLSAYQDRLLAHYEANPDFVQPDYRRNEMLGFIRQGLQDFSISRAGATWGIPFPILEDGSSSQRPDGTWEPGGRHDLRLVRRPDQLHHRRRIPGRSRRVPPLVAGGSPCDRQGHRAVPHHLLAGDAVVGGDRGAQARLGPRLHDRPGREDEQEPGQLPRPGSHGGRLRRGRDAVPGVARDPLRPRHGRVLGLVHQALQRGSGERLRQPRQPDGVDGQSVPGWGAPATPSRLRLAAGRGLGGHALACTGSGSTSTSSTTRSPSCWSSLAAPTRPSMPSSPGRSTRRRGRGTRKPVTSCVRCWAISWRPAAWWAWPRRRSCRRWRRASSSSWATTIRTGPTAAAARRCSTSFAGERSRRPGG